MRARSSGLCFLVVFSLSLAWCVPARSEVINIDFDRLPDGSILAPNTTLTDQYAAWGVLFSAFEDNMRVNSAVINTFVQDDPPRNSGNFWANTTSGAFGPRHDELRIDFLTPVSGVQWYTQGFGQLPIRFEAYDSSGVLLETVTVTHGPFYSPFVLTEFRSEGISQIRMFQTRDDWAWGLDNLRFDNTAIPEPASLTLLGVGALGLLGVRWRRRRQAAA